MIELNLITGGRLLVSPSQCNFIESMNGNIVVYIGGNAYRIKETFSDVKNLINGKPTDVAAFHKAFLNLDQEGDAQC